MVAAKEKPPKKKVATPAQAKAAAGSPAIKKTRSAKKVATAATAPAKPAGPTSLFDGSVKFASVGIGDSTARIGVAVDRQIMPLNRADNLLVGRRLRCKVTLGGYDESAGQSRLFDGGQISITGVCDVKGFRVGMDTIATALTYSLRDIDVGTLAKFSRGAGRLEIFGAEEIPDKEPSLEDDGTPLLDEFGEE